MPNSSGGPPSMPPPPAPTRAQSGNAPDLSLSFGKGPARGTSAPASPAKSRESLLQRVQSLTGAARDQGASIIGAAVQSATRPAFNKDRCFTLLVLDDQNTDWSKYFRGKRLHGDYDIRVEQAEFKEIGLASSSENGTTVSMAVFRGGTKVVRSFRPDFVLIRQPPRDGSRDYRSTLLGLKFGGVPCINSLNSVYQFQEKPWVFAHLLQLQRRLGKDNFPLIEQTFFPNARELFAQQFSQQKYPYVLKAGHCHGGTATAKIIDQNSLQEAAGLLNGSGLADIQCYCTLEPFIDAKFDVHVQKIGNNYKSFMRKSISGNWKTNQGSAMLEQIAMTEKYKSWINDVSEQFDGMEVCGLSIVVAKDGKEYILSACDSTLTLMGDTQEDDRRHIADLVVTRMQNVCRPSMAGKVPQRSSVSSRGSPSDENAPAVPPTASYSRGSSISGAPPPIPERTTPGPGSIGRHGSLSSVSSDLPEQPTERAPTLASVGRRDSAASQTSTGSKTSSRAPPQSQSSVVEDAEDTMKNLRKTFAGIFGDM
ncbi:synapsin-like [Sitodiplosis mosellana]|uniref:synapsin-like n=1 Tax=Sitodiplosis mosellana TaxID=263140 RepID=UPI002444D9A5|nr:synapsin-like [Sitodiplosis mosellana]